MALRPDEIKKVVEHLNSKWKNKACSFCSSNNWAVDGLVLLTLSDTSSNAFVIGGPAQPCASVACQTCGNTHLVNLIIAGVMKMS